MLNLMHPISMNGHMKVRFKCISTHQVQLCEFGTAFFFLSPTLLPLKGSKFNYFWRNCDVNKRNARIHKQRCSRTMWYLDRNILIERIQTQASIWLPPKSRRLRETITPFRFVFMKDRLKYIELNSTRWPKYTALKSFSLVK